MGGVRNFRILNLTIHALTLYLMIAPSFAAVNITNLLLNYDKVLPPNENGITKIKYDLRAPTLAELSEVETYFRLVITEYMVWEDPRLRYTPADSKE